MLFERSGDEGLEQRMGVHGVGFEFGVELTADKPGMIRNLHHFHQRTVGGCAAEDHAVLGQNVLVGVVEFVSVAMAFGYFLRLIGIPGMGCRAASRHG